MASLIVLSDDDDDPVTIPQPPTQSRVQSSISTVGGVQQEARRDYNSNSQPPSSTVEATLAIEPQTTASETSAVALNPRDQRFVLNCMYATRRFAAICDRLSVHSGLSNGLPTEQTLLRPVAAFQQPPDQSIFFDESSSTNDIYLQLEYGSVLLHNTEVLPEQGDSFDYSDVIGFATGREIEGDDETDRVYSKRVSSVDDVDNSPQMMEAARYQHTFNWSPRADVALPVTELVSLIPTLPTRDTQLQTFETTFQNSGEDLPDETYDVLQRVGCGVPNMFANLSHGAVTTQANYNNLRTLASTKKVRRNLETTLEAARLQSEKVAIVSKKNTEDDSELSILDSMASIEEALIEKVSGGKVPNMLRVRDSGPITVVGSLAQYDLTDVASSLLADQKQTAEAKRMLLDLTIWDDVAAFLASREKPGWQYKAVNTAWRGGMATKPSKKQRRVNAPIDLDEFVTISEAKKKKRTATESQLDSDDEEEEEEEEDEEEDEEDATEGMENDKTDLIEFESREVKEPRGVDTALDIEDIRAVENNLKETGFKKSGLKSAHNVNVRQVGFLTSTVYTRPAISIPRKWSAVKSLQQLEQLARTSEPNWWKSEQAWQLFIELAVYAKLVPRMSDDELFPLEARTALVDTLLLLRERCGNEITFHAESIKLYELEKPIIEQKLETKIEELNSQLAKIEFAKQLQSSDYNASETQANINALEAKLRRATKDLANVRNPVVLPENIVPAVLTLQFPSRRQLVYVEQTRGEQVGTSFTTAQRLALCVAYATVGRKPLDARTFFETETLTNVTPDADTYPVFGYLFEDAMKKLFINENDVVGPVAVHAFGTELGIRERVLKEETQYSDNQLAGIYLMRLYQSLKTNKTFDEATLNTALSNVVYRIVERHKTLNAVKHVFVIGPSAVPIETFAKAIPYMDDIHTEGGVFDLEALRDFYDVAVESFQQNIQKTMATHGSERLRASAAQRDVNEHFNASKYTIDDVALVLPGFNLANNRDSAPVGVFVQTGSEIVVDQSASLELLGSKQVLGGGHVVASNVSLFAQTDKNTEDTRVARLTAAEQNLATIEAQTNFEKNETVLESLLQQIIATRNEIDVLKRRAPKNFTGDTALLPFPYFVPPAVLATICGRVSFASFAYQSCAQFANWYATNEQAILEGLDASNMEFALYQRAVMNLVVNITQGSTAFFVDAISEMSVDEFINIAVQAMDNGQVVFLREETTRPDSVVTQPFSCLTALEKASTSSRLTIRDSFTEIWFQLVSARRWTELGYMRTPFNTSVTCELPLPNVNDAAFDNWQMLHLAVYAALRRMQPNADVAADEGDSDDESDEESDMDAFRRDGTVQLQTLLNQIESEVQRSMVANTLWFDLFTVAVKPVRFTSLVRQSLVSLYTALASGQRIATTSILASGPDNLTDKPVALDIRAQLLIDTYWKQYHTNNAKQDGEQFVELAELLRTVNDDQENASDQDLTSVVDDAFYNAIVAMRGASAAELVRKNPATQSALQRKAEKDAFEQRMKEQAAAAAKERATANRRSATQDELLRHVQQLVIYDNAEQEAYTNIRTQEELVKSLEEGSVRDPMQILSATEALRSMKEKYKRLTNDMASKESAIRQSYASDNVRMARIDELWTNAISLRRKVRLNLPGDRMSLQTPKDELASTMAELRAAIYADERPQIEQKINARIATQPGVQLLPNAPTPLQQQINAIVPVAGARRLMPAQQRIVNELRQQINDLRIIRAGLMSAQDVRELREMQRKKQDEIDASKEAVEQVETQVKAPRDAVDKAIATRDAGETFVDKRRDVPSQRPSIYDKVDEFDVAFGGYFDTVLAAHKQVTVDGVVAATRMMRDGARPSALESIRNVVEEADINTYLEYILDDVPIQQRFGPPHIRRAAREHMDRIVDAAIRDRVRLRIKLHRAQKNDTLLTGVDTSALLNAVTQSVNAEMVKYANGEFEGLPFRHIGIAALDIVVEQCRQVRDGQLVDQLRNSLGNVTIQRAENDEVVMPRIVSTLLLPAAIERAKILMQLEASEHDLPNWAVANRQDAPQSWRIAEIVSYFAQTGKLPLPGYNSSNMTLPYKQYNEIRTFNDKLEALYKQKRNAEHKLRQIKRAKETKKPTDDDDDVDDKMEEVPSENAKDVMLDIFNASQQIENTLRTILPTLSAVGRLRFFPDRVTALQGFGLAEQRVSFGNGVHYTQPFAVDLIAGALVAQLMQMYISVQIAYDGTFDGTIDNLWYKTQLDIDASNLTKSIAALPLARERLWCHLVMLFAKHGSQSDKNFLSQPRTLSLPVWQHMRAIDIRLLALVVLGYDYSDTTKVPTAYTRGHTNKYQLASTYLHAIVNNLFATLPENSASLNGIPPQDAKAFYAAVQQADGTTKAELRYVRRTVDVRTPMATRPGQTTTAQLEGMQLHNVVDRQIVRSWTSDTATTEVDMHVLLTFPRIGAKIANLVDRTGVGLVAAKKTLLLAVRATREEGVRIVDLPWLLIPNCVLIGTLVRMALAANDNIERTFPGYVPQQVWLKSQILETIEKSLLLNNGAGHMLQDDTTVNGSTTIIANAKSVESVVDEDEDIDDKMPVDTPVQPPSNVAQPPPPTDIRQWRTRIESAIKTLFNLPFAGLLVGTKRTAPFERQDWPFASVPIGTQKLSYTHQIAFVNNDAITVWALIRASLTSVKTFVDELTEPDQRLPKDVADAFRRRFTNLSERQQVFGALIARTEIERRRFWRFKANGTVEAPEQKLIQVAKKQNSTYQPWFVTLFHAVADEFTAVATRLGAVRTYIETFKDRQSVSPAIAYGRTVLAEESAKVSQLQLQQIVPIYDVLLYLFDNETGRGLSLYQTSQRFPLWLVMCTPIVNRGVLFVETTEKLVKVEGVSVHRTKVAMSTPLVYAARDAYTADEITAEAQSTQVVDTSRVAVLHSHVFTKSDNDAQSKQSKTYRPAALTTLARYEALPGEQTNRYSVHDAVGAALSRTNADVIIIGRIPVYSGEQ